MAGLLGSAHAGCVADFAEQSTAAIIDSDALPDPNLKCLIPTVDENGDGEADVHDFNDPNGALVGLSPLDCGALGGALCHEHELSEYGWAVSLSLGLRAREDAPPAVLAPQEECEEAPPPITDTSSTSVSDLVKWCSCKHVEENGDWSEDNTCQDFSEGVRDCLTENLPAGCLVDIIHSGYGISDSTGGYVGPIGHSTVGVNCGNDGYWFEPQRGRRITSTQEHEAYRNPFLCGGESCPISNCDHAGPCNGTAGAGD